MIQVEDVLKEATASLEEALVELAWTSVEEAGLIHFTGRGAEWRVELVVLGPPDLVGRGRQRVERMGTGTKGSLILKLTFDQADAAHRYARNYIQMSKVCSFCGQQLRHSRHWDTTSGAFCPFLEQR